MKTCLCFEQSKQDTNGNRVIAANEHKIKLNEETSQPFTTPIQKQPHPSVGGALILYKECNDISL